MAFRRHRASCHRRGGPVASLVREARQALEANGIATVSLSGRGNSKAVRAGTMHAMKGLEFQAVAVIGVEQGLVPAPGQSPNARTPPCTRGTCSGNAVSCYRGLHPGPGPSLRVRHRRAERVPAAPGGGGPAPASADPAGRRHPRLRPGQVLPAPAQARRQVILRSFITCYRSTGTNTHGSRCRSGAMTCEWRPSATSGQPLTGMNAKCGTCLVSFLTDTHIWLAF